ncbi:MarR family winged helix-turn-helix transcriptional regulator [Jatrophihabitans sp. DSM 45814]
MSTPADSDDAAEDLRQLAITFIAQSRVIFNDLDVLVRSLGLTGPLGELMWHLAPEEDPPAMKDLATAMHCDRSNITGLVERLVKQGLAERTEDPVDRRSKTIRLTPEGAGIRRTLLENFQERSVFSSLHPDEVRDLLRLLRKIG